MSDTAVESLLSAVRIGPMSRSDVAGLAMLTAVVPALYLAWRVRTERGKLGVVWFMMSMCAVGLYVFTFGMHSITNRAVTTHLFRRLVFLGTSTIAVSWFLLGIEYTFKQPLSWKAALPLLVVPAVVQVLVWFNPADLMFAEGTYVADAGYLVPEWGPAYLLDVGYNFTLALFTIGIWLGELATTEGQRRKQTGILVSASVLVFVPAVVMVLEVFPPYFDPTPVAFLGSGGLIAYALTEYEFLQITPIARETSLNEIEDAVVALDEDGRIADLNDAMRELLGPDIAVGADPGTAFDEYPELQERLDSTDPADGVLELETSGEKRYVLFRTTPVSYGRNLEGTVVVLRDVTALKEREQELDLLKQILSRVLRHNIRNDLTPITGYAELIAERDSGEIGTLAGKIHERALHLQDQSEKAYKMQQIVEDDETRTVDLEAVIDDVVASYRKNYPNSVIETETVEATATVHHQFGHALGELIENAIEHHDGHDRARIEIGLERHSHSGEILLTVADNGPGIPQSEIRVLDAEKETDLQHGSGVGLWLVRWVVRQSDGRLNLGVTGRGTRIEIALANGESTGEYRQPDSRDTERATS